MRVLSASQVGKYLECNRRWGWEYLERIRPPAHPSAALGTRVHSLLEAWLKDGVLPPEDTHEGKIAREGIPHLPPPHVAKVEGSFQVETPGGFRWKGFIDASHFMTPDGEWSPPGWHVPGAIPVIVDHKTTSNIKQWAKTEDMLRTDVQSQLYAYRGFELAAEAGCTTDLVALRWVYYQTARDKYKSHKVHLVVHRDHVAEQIEGLDKVASEIRAIESENPRALDLTPNPRACNDYGGCPHRERCALTKEEKGAIYTMAKEESILDKVRKLQEAKARASAAAPALPTLPPPPPSLPPPPPPAVTVAPPALPTLPPPPPPVSITAHVYENTGPFVVSGHLKDPNEGAAAEYLQARGAAPDVVAAASYPIGQINPPEAPPAPASPEDVPPVPPLPVVSVDPIPVDGLESLSRDQLKSLAVSKGLVAESTRMRAPGLLDLLRQNHVQHAPAVEAVHVTFPGDEVITYTPPEPAEIMDSVQIPYLHGRGGIVEQEALRDTFAAAALQGLLHSDGYGGVPDTLVAHAYQIADAMLAARARKA